MKRFLRLGLFLVFSLLLGLLGAFSWLSWQQANAFVFIGQPLEFLNVEGYENVEFRSLDGLLLRGWFRPPSRPDGASFLFVHGHGGNRTDFTPWANTFTDEGYGILLFDLRARGGSAGEFTTMGALEAGDVVGAFLFLQSQTSVNPERIAVFGHSMGAASILIASSELDEAQVLIAASSYTSVRNLLNDRIPTTVGIPALFFPDMIVAMSSYLSGTDYSLANPLGAVGNIAQPVLFITGDSDRTIPPNHSEILYNAANEPKDLQIIAGADHNSLFNSHFDEYLAMVRLFLERYFINTD